MRHLGSLGLCLVLVPVTYLLVGISGAKFSEAVINNSGSKHYTALAVCILAALAAGTLYGLLVLARLSPVGLVLGGLALIGVGFWSMFDLTGFLRTMPNSVLGVRNAAIGGPMLLVLSVPLLMTVFSPRRWRRWGSAPAAVAPSPGYAPPPTVPSYGSTPYSSYGSPEPSSPAGSYAAPGSPVGYPPPSSPYSAGDDPEATRRL
jgi:hypothetical protein